MAGSPEKNSVHLQTSPMVCFSRPGVWLCRILRSAHELRCREKKPMLDADIVTKAELGIMGSAFFFTYAIGKFSNGFLSDYANIGRFMSFSLFLSGLTAISLG